MAAGATGATAAGAAAVDGWSSAVAREATEIATSAAASSTAGVRFKRIRMFCQPVFATRCRPAFRSTGFQPVPALAGPILLDSLTLPPHQPKGTGWKPVLR